MREPDVDELKDPTHPTEPRTDTDDDVEDEDDVSENCYVGHRCLSLVGDSVVVSLPKRALRESLGLDAETIVGEQVRVELSDSGSYTIDIPVESD